MGKEPERRHSSYYPTSSLARTPSHGAEYSKYRGNNKIAVEQSQNNTKNSEYLNPINILGIPATTARRSSQDRPGSGVSAEGGGPPASRSNSSTAGRLGGGLEQAEHGRGNFRILKNSFGAAGRCGMGSLLNLNKIPHKTSLQRSNSARECGVAGDFSSQHTERSQVSLYKDTAHAEKKSIMGPRVLTTKYTHLAAQVRADNLNAFQLQQDCEL